MNTPPRNKITPREEAIYNLLCDERSRECFEMRRALAYGGGFLDNTVKFLKSCVSNEIGENFLCEFPEHKAHYVGLSKMIDMMRTSRFIIYGYSRTLRMLMDYAIANDRRITKNLIAVWDRNPELAGIVITPTVKTGMTPSEPDKVPDFDFLILSSSRFYTDSMLKCLDGLNVPRKKAVTYIVEDCVNQYFDPTIIIPRLSENEIFIDAGCLDFSTSRRLLELNPDVKKIYVFEPDAQNYKKILDSIDVSSFKGVVTQNAAWWSCDTALSFLEQESGTASSVASPGTGTKLVKACAIDSVIPQGETVTFIKMDIEGAELEALAGARNTISRCKPKLAICVYHCPDDYYKIAEYILSIIPEYKLFMRHYTTCPNETVLYCV